MKTTIRAPGHLSPEARRLWKKLILEYEISDAGGLEILAAGLSAYDRMVGARKVIDRDGMTFFDKVGQIKSHPLLPCERDNRAQWLQAIKNLNFDLEPLATRPGKPEGK